MTQRSGQGASRIGAYLFGIAVLAGATAPSATQARTVDVVYSIQANNNDGYVYFSFGGLTTVRYYPDGGSSVRPAQILDFDLGAHLRVIDYTGQTPRDWNGEIDMMPGGTQALGSLTATNGRLRLPLQAFGSGILDAWVCGSGTDCETRYRRHSVTLDFVFMQSGVTPLANALTDQRSGYEFGVTRARYRVAGLTMSSGIFGGIRMREVSRTVVAPEPTTGVLLSLGLLAGLASLTRRRRR